MLELLSNTLKASFWFIFTQARAKTELRENVTRDDALDVIEIVKMSLNQVMEHEHQGPPNSNVFEADPLYPGSKRVKRSSATPSFQTEVFFVCVFFLNFVHSVVRFTRFTDIFVQLNNFYISIALHNNVVHMRLIKTFLGQEIFGKIASPR